MKHHRIEKDILGSVKVPSGAYYGVFTARASENFKISGMKVNPLLNKSIIKIKMAAAYANFECGRLKKKEANAIIKACNLLLKNYSDYEDNFPLDVFQAGAGTPAHMNINEVIANLALEILGKKKGQYEFLDPHNHVNFGQSSNDVIPTAIRIASLESSKALEKELGALIASLKDKEKKFSSLVKAGRTHLQDALPITLGQEFGAYRSDLEKRLDFFISSLRNLRSLHIGGTAVGTGANAHRNFSKLAVMNLKKITSLDLSIAKNKIEETQFMSDFLDVSSALRTLATDLNKISNDLKLLSSGPVSGLNEISLPLVEPGSSIMPSKFNPSIIEMMNMVCFQVIGNDHVVQNAVEAGQLELNVMTPLIAHNLLESINILANAVKTFNEKCVKGIKPNRKVLEEYFRKNFSVGTLLNPVIGYDKTAELIKEAIKKNKPVKEVAIEKGVLTKKEADKIFSGKFG